MNDAKKDPNPLEDVRKGLGLLFRAARTAVQKLPTTRLEDVVLSSAKEVGRAMENVAHVVEREVTRRTGGSATHREPPGTQPSGAGKAEEDPAKTHEGTPGPQDERPPGPGAPKL